MRRNCIRKRRARHESLLSAERALKERKAARVHRKIAKAEAEELADALGTTVSVTAAASAPAPGSGDSARSIPGLSDAPDDVAMAGVARAKRGRVRKRNAHRKKAEERRNKIRARVEAVREDVDMLGLDEPAPVFKLGPLVQGGGKMNVDGERRSGRTLAYKKSVARAMKEERKAKARLLMREQVSLETVE